MYREIMQQGENVFLANMHDEWMSALGKLLEDKSLPTQIGLAGRQRGGADLLRRGRIMARPRSATHFDLKFIREELDRIVSTMGYEGASGWRLSPYLSKKRKAAYGRNKSQCALRMSKIMKYDPTGFTLISWEILRLCRGRLASCWRQT